MSRNPHASSRGDWVWILIPLVIPVFLFTLHRVPLFEHSPGVLRAMVALVMIPASLLLVLRAARGALGAQPKGAATAILLAALVAGAAAMLIKSFAPLQTAFLLFFALLAVRAAALAGPPRPAAWRDRLQLTKPALTGMVLVSVMMGFYLASPGPMAKRRLASTLLGVALLGGAAGTLNQVAERARDRRMPRTARRPLPARRLQPAQAVRQGALLGLGGMLILASTVNLATAWMATFSFALYLYVYTPLKRASTLATLVGAVSGALPPLLGWFGAGGALTPAALVLFFILYLWQIPHFLAIVWKYRAQYRAAGFRLYGVLDSAGHATGLQALLYAAALLPVSLMMTWHGLTGLAYLFGAFALGLVFIAFSAAFALRPEPLPTRRLFIASIAYLPILLLYMVIDRWI